MLTVRMPEYFWKQAKQGAKDRRMSLNDVVILGICLILNLDEPPLPISSTRTGGKKK
jgi:hypothetical protein